jgi:RNA polymerase sigma factor (sigma-70 family)
VSRAERAGGEPIDGAHLREAERGLRALLRAKGFPAAWVDKNAIDLLAQAAGEYAEWLKGHRAEPNPVGWLLTCAYRRAVDLLDSEGRRPPTTSLDAVVDLGDRGTPTPEQEALANDRQRRLREAMRCLPARDRRLISLVYFEECSIREAGRRLGWRKTVADRRHQEALQRLREIVGADRSLLSPAGLGFAAWVAASEGRTTSLSGLPHALGAVAQGAGAPVGDLARRLAAGARRLMPFTESGSAAASAGAGRVAGACGAGLVAAVCGLAAVGVHPSLSGGGGSPSRPHVTAPKPRKSSPPQAIAPQASEKRESADAAEGTDSSGQSSSGAGESARSRRPAAPSSRQASKQVVEEFGIEREPAPAASDTQSTTEAPESPSHSTSRPHRASGAQVEEEFGL